MRQRNFLVGVLFAILTFASLTAAFGWRHHGGHSGWRHDACYEDHNRGRHEKNAPGAAPFNDQNSTDKKQE